MSKVPAIKPCLWFENQAEEAVEFYVSIFDDAKVVNTIVADDPWPGGQVGDVIAIDFQLNGQPLQALNGGPGQPFNDRVSLSITCKDQPQLDRIWEALIADGGTPVMCGWLHDKFGMRWQVVPEVFYAMVNDEDVKKRRAVMQAMMQMVKLDISSLQKAFED